jgi:RNase P/RNase MRP subunit POP5
MLQTSSKREPSRAEPIFSVVTAASIRLSLQSLTLSLSLPSHLLYEPQAKLTFDGDDDELPPFEGSNVQCSANASSRPVVRSTILQLPPQQAGAQRKVKSIDVKKKKENKRKRGDDEGEPSSEDKVVSILSNSPNLPFRQSLSTSDLYHSLKTLIPTLFGLIAGNLIVTALRVEGYDPLTGIWVIKTGRADYGKVWVALGFLKELKGRKMRVQCIAVVGGGQRTLGKVLERGVRREVRGKLSGLEDEGEKEVVDSIVAKLLK